jgi:hypothetical protein
MGIKIKLSTIVHPQFTQALGKLCQQKMPLADTIRMARVGRVVKTENENFRNAQLAFFKANGGTEDKATGVWSIDFTTNPEVHESYEGEMSTALAEEIELPLLVPFKLPDTCDLTALDLIPLLDIIQTEIAPPEAAPK